MLSIPLVLTRGFFFQLNPLEVAIQLMVEDFTIFSQIETTEYIDKVFELKSRFGIPNLTKFEDLVNKVILTQDHLKNNADF